LVESLFPAVLQCRRHKPVCRINGLIPAFSQLNLVAGALSFLLPMLVETLSLLDLRGFRTPSFQRRQSRVNECT
jgi:hypothetical protein